MPTLDDIVASSKDKSKQHLQEALLELLKGNPDILDSVTKSTTRIHSDVATRSGDEEERCSQRSPSSDNSYPELENSLNQQPRASYQWQLSDSVLSMCTRKCCKNCHKRPNNVMAQKQFLNKDDGIDSAWTTATKNMSPRELNRWRKTLFSIYVGHLPYDITKKELVQLFSEVGNVQDCHLQPQEGRGGGYTYGFVRFCTLDECRDAVAMLHGRLLGNRTITVEFACETKERLSTDDPDDLLVDKKDRLLRKGYPRIERRSPMSEAESQEKMVLWKLRCSATRQKSSNTRFLINGQEANEEEVLMNALQEIVKKVASLPADTFATPSASEGSPCSPWILNEINGSNNGVAVQQSHFTESPDMHMKEEAVKCNRTQESVMPQQLNIEHALDKESTNIHEEGTRQPQILPLIRERNPQSQEENVANSFSPPDSQSLRNGPFPARLSPSNPGVASSPESYVSANNSVVTPSAGRDFSLSHPGVNPSPDGSVSLGSLGASPSPGKQMAPVSPAMSPSPGRHVSPTNPDVTTFSGRDFSPSSPDITPSSVRYPSPSDATPSSGRYLSPSSAGVTSSPGQDESLQSEVETNASDSVSVGSLSPERPLRQHCKFCHGQSPTRGHVSDSSLSETVSSSSSRSSCAFCCEEVSSCGRPGTSDAMAEKNLQRDNMHLLETPAMKDGVCGRPPKNLSEMGLCSFDSNGPNSNETQYPSRCVQQREASTSGYLPPQEQIIDQASAGGNALSRVDVRGSNCSAANHTTALPSSQWHSPKDQSAFAQGSVSPLQKQTHVVRGSLVTKKEDAEIVPSAAKLSPVTRHHQQVRPLQNKEGNSITSPAVPVAPLPVSVAPSPSNERAPLMQKPLSSAPAPKPLISPPTSPTSPPAIRPLMGNSPYWPGQHQHAPPLLSNFLASRFQQPGFPRHQFGNAPFVPPGVFNPAMFQRWDTNALIQQQLLASRLPFGLPFQPRQNAVPRFRPPAGGRSIGAAGRGRPIAPRFHNPGIVNIKTCGDLEKMNTGRSSTFPPEAQKETVGENRPTGSDATASSPVNLSPENTDVESRSREASRVKSTSVGSCRKSGSSPSSASDLSVTSISDTIPKESREETRYPGFQSSPGPGKCESVSEEHQVHTLSLTSSLPKQEGDCVSPGTKKISPSKISPSELLLKEKKSELKRIMEVNELLRQCIDWRRSAEDTDNRGALKSQIHLKEVQLQKEKEIMLARKAEQELLYEREKLEAAFDQQLKKELETEQRIGDTENKICLAKLENELLVLYQKLYERN